MPKGYPKNGINTGQFKKGHIISSNLIELNRVRMIGNKYSVGIKYSKERKEKMSHDAKKREFGKWMTGKKHSNETKKKMSQSHIGKNTWTLGVKRSEESKKTQSLAQTGRKQSDITKLKLSLINKGQKPTKYCMERSSEVNKGKIISPETRLKISNSSKGRVAKNKGKKESIETRIKRSKSLKKAYIEGRHPNYKGGITPVNQKARTSFELKCWKKSCMERDNFTCQKTGQIGGRLVVHHINNFADFPELRTSIENGITLSKESHIEFHKKYGIKNNSRKQLEEFLKN